MPAATALELRALSKKAIDEVRRQIEDIDRETETKKTAEADRRTDGAVRQRNLVSAPNLLIEAMQRASLRW